MGLHHSSVRTKSRRTNFCGLLQDRKEAPVYLAICCALLPITISLSQNEPHQTARLTPTAACCVLDNHLRPAASERNVHRPTIIPWPWSTIASDTTAISTSAHKVHLARERGEETTSLLLLLEDASAVLDDSTRRRSAAIVVVVVVRVHCALLVQLSSTGQTDVCAL